MHIFFKYKINKSTFIKRTKFINYNPDYAIKRGLKQSALRKGRQDETPVSFLRIKHLERFCSFKEPAKNDQFVPETTDVFLKQEGGDDNDHKPPTDPQTLCTPLSLL